MEEKKDNKASKKRGFVATVIGNKKTAAESKDSTAKEESKPSPKKTEEKKPNDARRTQREALKRKRAADERKRKAAREERERLAKEKAQQIKEKSMREKAEKARKEDEQNRQYTEFAVESGTYETTLNKMYLNRKPWQDADPKQIMSFMPGTVEEILVKKGDEIKAGDVLMIFRAMKMSNRMLSPVDGKVIAINVAQGENVSKNTLMIELA